jgi:hypothetical protein
VAGEEEDRAVRSQTLMRPSKVVAARNWPSSLRAMAQISPAVLACAVFESSVTWRVSRLIQV